MRRAGFGSALAIPVLAVTIGALAACGSGKSNDGIATVSGAQGNAGAASPVPTSTMSVQQQRLAFAQCMRDHGVDMADPGADGGFGFGGGGGGGGAGASPGAGGNRVRLNDPTVQAAFTACRTKLPGGGQPPKLSAAQVTQYRVWAQCMRDNGANVPDPNADGTLTFGRGTGQGQFNPQDPTFRTANTACQDKRPQLRASGGPR